MPQERFGGRHRRLLPAALFVARTTLVYKLWPESAGFCLRQNRPLSFDDRRIRFRLLQLWMQLRDTARSTGEPNMVAGLPITLNPPSLEDAIILAAEKHRGQKDKAGAAYIRHPMRVMGSKYLTNDNERMVGALHDVIEDCGVTVDDLLHLGYPKEVVEAIVCMSKTEDEEGDDPDGHKYRRFIARIAAGPEMAVRGKLADLEDNSDLTRLTEVTFKDRQRLKKYQEAKDVLLARISSNSAPNGD
jgi:hypothetical protein